LVIPPRRPFREARILALTDPETVVKGTDFQGRGSKVAKSELGTKRIDPETGRKFYDLNKDPIVSPYTGKTYPLSYFESAGSKVHEEEEVEEKELDTEEEGAEVVSLEEAEDEAKTADDLPEIEDEEDVDLGDDDEDVFLEDEEEDDDDVSDIIGVGDDDDV
jgi:uncharacterized protein (TIGR02300 family)